MVKGMGHAQGLPSALNYYLNGGLQFLSHKHSSGTCIELGFLSTIITTIITAMIITMTKQKRAEHQELKVPSLILLFFYYFRVQIRLYIQTQFKSKVL